MTRAFRLAASLAVFLSPLPAAADSWQPVAITSFLKEAPTWMPNCAGKDGGRLFVSTTDIGQVKDAALNEDLSCVKFSFRGKSYFVRETVVEQTGAKHSSVGACQYTTASLGMSASAHEGTTMGAGEGVRCNGQH
jgi:hypothetical protein